MEFEVQKKEHMQVYWEQSTCRIQEVNSNIEEEDEGYEIKKPQMKNAKNK